MTFFAYLGFGVISFVGGDIVNPKKNMPRAMYIAIGFTLLLYVALAVGVFGTLTVDEVIANADTALAVAAYPIFGVAGVTLISISALFSTTGAINSQLYASIGATFAMAKDGQLPPVFALKRRRREGGTQGLVISALLILALAILFDVSAIASIGSAVALAIFAMITIAHLRMRKETGASVVILILALLGNNYGNPAVFLVHLNDRSTDLCDLSADNHPGLGGRGSMEIHQQTRSEPEQD